MKKDLAYFQGLPYKLRIDRFVEPEDGLTYYCAQYPELPTVKGVHTDRLVAIKLARELFDSYVEAHLEWGKEIPEPATTRSPKRGGRWAFRNVSRAASDSDRSGAQVSTEGSDHPASVCEGPHAEDSRFTTDGSGAPQLVGV